MPRKPTSDVTGLRIDLGTKERQLLESFAISYRIQAISRPMQALVANPANILILYQTLGIIYERITGKDLPFVISSTEDAGQAIAEFLNAQRKEWKEKKKEGFQGYDFTSSEIEQILEMVSRSIFGGIADDWTQSLRETEAQQNESNRDPYQGVDLF